MESYVISASLGTGCYRHIQIGASATLFRLHQAILSAFEFEDDHEHAFFMDNHVWSPYDAYYSTQMEPRNRVRAGKKERNSSPQRPMPLRQRTEV